MSCSFDIASSIAAIGTMVAAGAAVASWRVASRLLNLQKSIEDSKKPIVHIWINSTGDSKRASITIVNIGSVLLPIRSLRIKGNNDQAVSFSLEEKYEGVRVLDSKTAMLEAFASHSQQKLDLLLEPNVVYRATFTLDTAQPILEVMYYDGSFEFVKVDTSQLGGKYVLAGKGKVPS